MSLSKTSSFGFAPSASASTYTGLDEGTKPKTGVLSFEGSKERIKNMFNKVELSVSPYDTAWVAMVPSPSSPAAPFFPQCISWLLDNQFRDGSWGPAHSNSLLKKDSLLSTLACILALKRWNIGPEHVNNGLGFIESNLASANDERQHSPVGFDIIFPGMIEYAENLGLAIPLRQANRDVLFKKRELDLRRVCSSGSEGRGAYLGYVSEGMGKLQDWEMVMKYQRKNGSLFNSPSTTAAAFTYVKNDGCLEYLCLLLDKFGNAAPAIYPCEIYARLSMVDSLQRMGIDRHFSDEITGVLNETYRCWLVGEEDIFLDPATCAMAFRLLRINGYDVSSEPLHQYSQEEYFSKTLGGYMKDIGCALELFKASQITIDTDEPILEKINSWTSDFLFSRSSTDTDHSERLKNHIEQEVSDALRFSHQASLERLSNRRAIESYCMDSTKMLKTSFRCSNVGNEDFLRLAVEDFNFCQHIHRQELQDLARWIVENRLDKLKFARQKLEYCYFSAAATLFAPELSDARLSWAKNGVLTTVVDDFFDIGGSEEELVNLVQLIEGWDVNGDINFCSKEVEIIFLVLRSTIDEIADKALIRQGRSVKCHVIDTCLQLLKAMLKEAKWSKNKVVPQFDEYMTNGYISVALGPIVLPALYLVGPKLSKEVVGNSEYQSLFKLMSICGRLLNDIRSFERESREGKLNAVSLHLINGGSTISKEAAIREIESSIERKRRELFRLVLQEKGSTIPRACKDLFWKMSRVLHLFYMKNDGFTSREMIKSANALIEEALDVDRLLGRV